MTSRKQHKLFQTSCDQAEPHPVTAIECEKCTKGNVIDGRSRVVCGGVTKFFMTPCCNEMRAAAMIIDCEKCEFGEVSEDRVRVFCSRM